MRPTESKSQDESPVKTRIVLQIWSSSRKKTTVRRLMKDSKRIDILMKKARPQGQTGHIALLVEKEVPIHSPTQSPNTPLYIKTIIKKENKKFVKVQQQRFSFNPENLSVIKLIGTLFGKGVKAAYAEFRDDCVTGIDEKEFKTKAEQLEKEIKPVKDYIQDGINTMQKIMREQRNPKEIIPILMELLQTATETVTEGSEDTTLLFKAARTTLLKNMLNELIINIKEFMLQEESDVDLFSESLSKLIIENMQQLLDSEKANLQFANQTAFHLAELEHSKRTPLEVDISYLNIYMDAEQLQSLMVKALQTDYSLSGQTCIQVTLNIVLKGLANSESLEARDILKKLVQLGDVVEVAENKFEINSSKVNTLTDAFIFSNHLKTCFEQVRAKALADAKYEQEYLTKFGAGAGKAIAAELAILKESANKPLAAGSKAQKKAHLMELIEKLERLERLEQKISKQDHKAKFDLVLAEIKKANPDEAKQQKENSTLEDLTQLKAQLEQQLAKLEEKRGELSSTAAMTRTLTSGSVGLTTAPEPVASTIAATPITLPSPTPSLSATPSLTLTKSNKDEETPVHSRAPRIRR